MKEVNSVSDATNTYGEDIKLTTTDASTLYKTIITELEKGAGEPLYPGDERRIFGEALVPVFVALYNSLNDVGRQTLLRYARGEVLDAIGERQDVKRLEGTPAKTTMRFSVSTPQEKNIIIPKWTKVTPDSENYFATDEIAVLQAGAYSVEVPTSAVSNGTKFNGYAAGTITTLVDLIPYIESVTNLTETAGGEDIKLTTTDASTLYKTIITELEKGAGEPLYPGDERRIFGEALVPVFVALYNSLNDVGRQTLLRYARGEVLDAIGERQDVKRLEGTPAKTTMRFSVSTPQEKNIIIPKWTKVTPDSENYFATDEIAVLQAGAYSVEVPTSAVSNGTKFNGYAAGTITTLVDLIPYIESVTNLTETAGGDDGEPYTTEGDNRLRERIRLAPAKRSTAGPEQAYIYWVMTADSSIVDAKAVSEKETVSETLTVYDGKAFKGGGTLLTDTLVVKAHGQSAAAVKDTDYTVDYADGLLAITLKGSLAAAESIDIIITRTLEGCVKIVPLLEGGGIPDAAMLAKVLDVVNAKDIRPLTDKVSAVPPEVETYDIEIVYYTTPESEAEVIANVEGTGGAIDRYNEWQVAALGRDINPDQLRKRILSPSWGENLTGAFRVDVVKPTYKALDDTQVAKFSGHLTVSHKVESEVV